HLYKPYPEIACTVHTHSTWPTISSQAGLDLTAMATTQTDTCSAPAPCARCSTPESSDRADAVETADVSIETLEERGIAIFVSDGVLLHGHAPFTWGKNVQEAVMNSVVLEEVSKMNLFTRQLNSCAEELPQRILDKHYLRKHGKNAYYGQG